MVYLKKKKEFFFNLLLFAFVKKDLNYVQVTFKGKHSSGNKDNCESGQNKSKACSYTLEDGECNPL